MTENDDDSDSEAREQEDPLALTLDPDLLTKALNNFFTLLEDRAMQNEMNGGTKATKAKANFETEEQKGERQKRKQQIYWEKMTTILTTQKQSVWSALD